MLEIAKLARESHSCSCHCQLTQVMSQLEVAVHDLTCMFRLPISRVDSLPHLMPLAQNL